MPDGTRPVVMRGRLLRAVGGWLAVARWVLLIAIVTAVVLYPWRIDARTALNLEAGRLVLEGTRPGAEISAGPAAAALHAVPVWLARAIGTPVIATHLALTTLLLLGVVALCALWRPRRGRRHARVDGLAAAVALLAVTLAFMAHNRYGRHEHLVGLLAAAAGWPAWYGWLTRMRGAWPLTWSVAGRLGAWWTRWLCGRRVGAAVGVLVLLFTGGWGAHVIWRIGYEARPGRRPVDRIILRYSRAGEAVMLVGPPGDAYPALLQLARRPGSVLIGTAPRPSLVLVHREFFARAAETPAVAWRMDVDERARLLDELESRFVPCAARAAYRVYVEREPRQRHAREGERGR